MFPVFKEKTCRSLGLIRHNFSIKPTTRALGKAPTVQLRWFGKVLPLLELQNPFFLPPHPHLGLACFLFSLNCGIMHIRFTILAILNYTIQCHLAHSQSCATITTIQFQNTFMTSEGNPSLLNSHSPPPAPGNH